MNEGSHLDHELGKSLCISISADGDLVSGQSMSLIYNIAQGYTTLHDMKLVSRESKPQRFLIRHRMSHAQVG